MTIGERLKKIRLFLGLTQTEMAAGVVTESFYSKVERDVSKIKIGDLLDILNKNGVTLEDFFEIADDTLSQKAEINLRKAITDYSKEAAHDLMKLVFKEGKENNVTNKTQAAQLAITYLERCYQECWREYGKETIEFIKDLPPYPILAIVKLTAQYYQALFNKDETKLSEIKDLLIFNGYQEVADKLPNLRR